MPTEPRKLGWLKRVLDEAVKRVAEMDPVVRARLEEGMRIARDASDREPRRHS